MSARRRISSKYWSAIRDSLCLQAFFVILGNLALDGGQLGRFCLFVLVPYWIVAILILMRRPSSPTPLDLTVIRFGYLALLGLMPLVSTLVDPLLASAAVPSARSGPASRLSAFQPFRLSDFLPPCLRKPPPVRPSPAA
jgi:hypothetical protein